MEAVSSRGWLPIVEAPRCLWYLHMAMLLLIFKSNNVSLHNYIIFNDNNLKVVFSSSHESEYKQASHSTLALSMALRSYNYSKLKVLGHKKMIHTHFVKPQN